LEIAPAATRFIDLAILLRVRYPNCRIALSSGHPATDDLLAAATASGHAFEIVVKPAHPEELLLRML